MAAGGGTTVVLADPQSFHSMATSYLGTKDGFTTTLILDGVIIQGWEVVEGPFIEPCYRLILRKTMDGLKETGIYACILLSDDGEDMDVCQFILIENDDDYEARGDLRFNAFPVLETLIG